MRDYNDRKRTFEGNCIKAGALFYSYCNRTTQNRLNEISDFNVRVKKKPVIMLQEISKKMYDPQKVVYPFDTITKVFNRLFEIDEDHNGSLSYYRKRFKQMQDDFTMIFGTEALYKYIEQMPEYISSKSSEKDKVKAQSMFM